MQVFTNELDLYLKLFLLASHLLSSINCSTKPDKHLNAKIQITQILVPFFTTRIKMQWHRVRSKNNDEMLSNLLDELFVFQCPKTEKQNDKIFRSNKLLIWRCLIPSLHNSHNSQTQVMITHRPRYYRSSKQKQLHTDDSKAWLPLFYSMFLWTRTITTRQVSYLNI